MELKMQSEVSQMEESPQDAGRDGDVPADGSHGDDRAPYMRAASKLNLFARGSAAGSLVWLPNGARFFEALKDFSWRIHRGAGYGRVRSPGLVDRGLLERSGHMEKYADLVFPAGEGLVMRPMSCPNHIIAWEALSRGESAMPVRFFEFGDVFRNEPSGSLQAMFRMRQFCQDDGHVFAMRSQARGVVAEFLKFSLEAYARLGFKNPEVSLSLRPEVRFGDDALWDGAEGDLRMAAADCGLSCREQPGEGAFYGPKLEISVRDARGRAWQMGVVQLDYVLPERFDLSYVASGVGRLRPVLIHHAMLGSVERMAGALLEIFGVSLPPALHPVPCAVAAVSDKQADCARAVFDMVSPVLEGSLLLADAEPLGAKIRRARSMGCPFVLVVGQRERDSWLDSGSPVASLDGGRVEVGPWLAGVASEMAGWR